MYIICIVYVYLYVYNMYYIMCSHCMRMYYIFDLRVENRYVDHKATGYQPAVPSAPLAPRHK